MTKKTVTINLVDDFQATPAAMLVQIASQFDSSIYLESESKNINAKSIMGMMSLGLISGDKVTISADGVDEEKAISEIESYLSR